MEKKHLIERIKSIYILQSILSYIADENIKYKLFKYSKSYQKKLNIGLVNYKEKYLEKIGFNIDDYLYQEIYEKNNLINKYNDFLLKNELNKEEFEKIVYDVQKKENLSKIEENYEELINIDSPLFEIISRTKNFENNYSIYISQEDIDKYKLKKQYKNFFDKLNITNINYSSIYYYFIDKEKKNYLKELNIDFKKIRRITIIYDDSEYTYSDDDDGEKVPKDVDKNYFRSFFSINDFQNNLIYLKIDYYCCMESELFENINNYKSLQYLFLISLKFNNNFTINL
jgi:hypothetical protein